MGSSPKYSQQQNNWSSLLIEKKLRICLCPEGTANADGGRISAIKKAGAIGTQIAEFMGKVMHLLMAMKETWWWYLMAMEEHWL